MTKRYQHTDAAPFCYFDEVAAYGMLVGGAVQLELAAAV